MFFKNLNEKGLAPVILLFIAAAGLIGFFVIASATPFKDSLYNTLFPKPASHAAPALPDAPEASFTMELEKDPNSPFPDEALPEFIEEGKNFRVDIYTRSDLDSSNLFVAQVNFPKDLVEVVEVNKREGSSLIKQWVETSVNNDEGTISMVGGIPNPGIKTETQTNYLFGSVVFKAKKSGNVQLGFGDKSGVFKNSDNSNMITDSKYLRGIGFDIKTVPAPTQTPVPTGAPTAQPTAQPSATPIADTIQTLCSDISLTTGAIIAKNQGGQDIYIVNSEGGTTFTFKPNAQDQGISISWSGSAGQFVPDPANPLISKFTAPKVDEDQKVTIKGVLKKGGLTKECSSEIVVKKPIPPVVKELDKTEKPLRRDGDINSDGKFDYVDLSALLSQFNPAKTDVSSEADLNSDKVINTFDLVKIRGVLTEKGILGRGSSQGSSSSQPNQGNKDQISLGSCSDAQTKIKDGGDYVLAADIGSDNTGSQRWDSSNCINLTNKKNINIDCQGHVIGVNYAGGGDNSVYVLKSSDISFKNCKIKGNRGYISVYESKNITFQNFEELDASYGLIKIVDGENVSFKDSTLKVAADNFKINISRGKGIIFDHNVITGLLDFASCTNCQLINNSFNTVFDGNSPSVQNFNPVLSIHNGSGNQILNNNFNPTVAKGTVNNKAYTGGNVAIQIDSESNGTVKGNTFVGFQTDIVKANLNNVTISDNTYSNSNNDTAILSDFQFMLKPNRNSNYQPASKQGSSWVLSNEDAACRPGDDTYRTCVFKMKVKNPTNKILYYRVTPSLVSSGNKTSSIDWNWVSSNEVGLSGSGGVSINGINGDYGQINPGETKDIAFTVLPYNVTTVRQHKMYFAPDTYQVKLVVASTPVKPTTTTASLFGPGYAEESFLPGYIIVQ